MTWGEVIRQLKAVGFVEHRSAKGSHLQLIHPHTKQVITVAVHTKQDAGHLGNRILKDAGVR
jgi:predicted RNA binding protein YcfA (HicA-like mRNA interferase family)